MKSTPRIILTGGGTAGHVTPNLALLPLLRERGFDIRYIGTSKGMERSLIAKENIPYDGIPAGKLRRYADIRNVTDIVRIKLGFLKSLFLIATIRPDVVFSKGGFVACPVVWASWLLRVPVIVHESDISPGLANRLSFPFASRICYSFPETALHLPRSRAVETGIPVRGELLTGSAAAGRSLCGFTDAKPVLMVIGGSQGAQAINVCLREGLDALLLRFNIIHCCGRGNLAGPQAGYAQFEYADEELADLFALADAVVSRAGATALFELLALKKPSLLIPLPRSASRGDQILNARSFESRGFSIVLPQEEMTGETLIRTIELLFNRRAGLAARMRDLAPIPAAQRIVALIEEAAMRKTGQPRREKDPHR
jgi:UDP-N-acetylglucosamine--N-acetylmuramyl-(pentapeptide) pyrophosphoryl-undecaprenol N-acetylglucosamine transferase